MSVPSTTSFSYPHGKKQWGFEQGGGFVEQLLNAGQFLRGLQVKMRFGMLTRAPIRLIRLQVCDEVAECDWLARAPDPWDADLTRSVQQRHVSLQSLRDAIDVRALLFNIMPQAQTAYFRAYRESSDYTPEMIITGCTHRNDHTSRDVHSLQMRARVLGFRFNMEGDILRTIQAKEQLASETKPGDQTSEHSKQTLNPFRDAPE
jgi:hypothetical protein